MTRPRPRQSVRPEPRARRLVLCRDAGPSTRRCRLLDGDRSCDVCVVGGGYTGAATALHLARRGVDVLLLEQSRLGWGASGRNGGQAHVGLRRDQDWLEARLGSMCARRCWALALAAREHLDWLIASYCDRLRSAARAAARQSP